MLHFLWAIYEVVGGGGLDLRRSELTLDPVKRKGERAVGSPRALGFIRREGRGSI